MPQRPPRSCPGIPQGWREGAAGERGADGAAVGHGSGPSYQSGSRANARPPPAVGSPSITDAPSLPPVSVPVVVVAVVVVVPLSCPL